jgi:translation initiation factor IF-3
VLLIDPDGKQLGIKPLPEALSIARQLDLDLVEVAAEANPPVCRVMDYNRFKYEAAQRAKESRRKATSTGIKEMKYRPKIGIGDFDTKTRQVARFLGEGHKVKITIMFRGREMSHPDLGKKILDQVAEAVAETGKVESAPKLDGRNMIMVLAPDRRAQVRKPTPNGDHPSPTPAGNPSVAQGGGDGNVEGEAGAEVPEVQPAVETPGSSEAAPAVTTLAAGSAASSSDHQAVTGTPSTGN